MFYYLISTKKYLLPTRSELAGMERNEQLEARQNHYENQAKKCRRIADHSLDPDNRRIYSARADDNAKKAAELSEKLPKQVDNPGESGIIGSNKDNDHFLSIYVGEPIIETDDVSIRKWYIANVQDIPNHIDKSLSLEEQAYQAFELRNELRRKARIAMTDKEKVAMLEIKRPIQSFEQLIKSKMERKGMTRKEAIEDIIKTATKTNKAVNKDLGL